MASATFQQSAVSSAEGGFTQSTYAEAGIVDRFVCKNSFWRGLTGRAPFIVTLPMNSPLD